MSTINIARFTTGPLETNTYVVSPGAGTDAIIVDPSSRCGAVLDHCGTRKLTVRAIVLTHAHFDHMLGIP
jgi:hydroxyacylglutathione hydrolase